MLLGFLTIVIMLAVAYAYLREGVFTAFVMCCNVFLAGLVAFNFWEPLANQLDPALAGYEDILCLILLFSLTLGLLRAVTNSLSRTQIDFPPAVQRGGGAIFGLAAGYLVSAFLVCVLETLPWHENFMFFEWQYDSGQESPLRAVLPPDRLWLATMHRAGAYAFSNNEDGKPGASSSLYDRYKTFDKYGTFSLRYARYRRYGDNRDAATYQGEFDREIHRRP
jgi:hypothetical protein